LIDMTGEIFEIKPFAIHDGPGIRTTVFFKGCPLDCCWCHNPEARGTDIEKNQIRRASSGNKGMYGNKFFGKMWTVSEVMNEISRDEIFYNESDGGVTFSGGEPMSQVDFLKALLESCKSSGFKTAVDTCGYAPSDDFEGIYDVTDLFLFDLKIFDREEHIEYTGLPNDLILQNLTILAGKGRKVVVRIPMVPGITDTDQNLEGLLSIIMPLKSVRTVHLLPYNKMGEDKIDRFGLSRKKLMLDKQTDTVLRKKAEIFESSGYNVVIGG